MSLRLSVSVLVLAVGMTGCSAMEQYHFPQTQDKVPVNVIVAFSEAYPNDTIKSITEQKMFDGVTRYQFVVADSKNVERTVAFTQEGAKVNPL